MRIQIGANLPTLRIESLRASAGAIGVDLPLLDLIASRADEFYRPFQIPKPDGSSRNIDNPKGSLKLVQSRVNRRLLGPLTPSPIAFGGVRGRSHLDGVARHVGKEAVGCIDITDFFPSITHHHVYSLLVALGCSPDVARLLTRLLTYNGHLPQGSPASTTVANLVLHDLDQRLMDRAEGVGASVSRIVDDVAISGDLEAVSELLGASIREIHRLGLRVNRMKTKIQRAGHRQRVCNLNVNDSVSVPKRRKKHEKAGKLIRKFLRDQVRRAARYGISDHERASLAGKIRYVAAFHPRTGNHLLAVLEHAPRETA